MHLLTPDREPTIDESTDPAAVRLDERVSFIVIKTHRHQQQLTRAGKLEHNEQPLGSIEGWRVSVPWDSVGLPSRQSVCSESPLWWDCFSNLYCLL